MQGRLLRARVKTGAYSKVRSSTGPFSEESKASVKERPQEKKSAPCGASDYFDGDAQASCQARPRHKNVRGDNPVFPLPKGPWRRCPSETQAVLPKGGPDGEKKTPPKRNLKGSYRSLPNQGTSFARGGAPGRTSGRSRGVEAAVCSTSEKSATSRGGPMLFCVMPGRGLPLRRRTGEKKLPQMKGKKGIAWGDRVGTARRKFQRGGRAKSAKKKGGKGLHEE